MTDTAKAVFLSYASQDAEAAKRIADTLRAAGIEVWFDAEGGLEHGDEWDRKIRRQIKECVLFIAVISANTQAREEGYFRIEWELAAQRALGIASGVAFILPIVIDETREPAALVPDKFRTVQWTKLPGGVVPADVLQRFLKLWSHRTGALKAAGTERPAAQVEAAARSAAIPRPGWKVYAGLAVVCLAIAAGAMAWLARKTPPAPVLSSAASGGGNPAPAGTRVWPHDPELKRVLDLIDSLEATLEDYRLADEISARAVERAPTDPEAVTVRARVHSAFLTRNFDFSAERGAQARRFGERAVQLAPDEPNAYYALSLYLDERAGEAARAETLAHKACELAPDEPRFHRQLMRVVLTERPEEGLAMGEDLIKRFPRDVLTHYELSIAYRNRHDWEKFEREIDATLALAPLPNAVNWKARAGLLHNDLTTMRHWIDQVPARQRSEERTVVTAIVYAALSGDSQFGLKSLQGFAEPWFYDTFNYAGPAALPRAMLFAEQGKTGLAREQYELALTEVARHRKAYPTDQNFLNAEIWILLGLARLEEARPLQRTLIESLRRPFQVTALAGWWFDSIPRSLLIGDRPTAIQLIREAATQAEARQTIRQRMQMDVRMAPFRDDPEITALLAEPAQADLSGTAPAKADDKSVAVLAFANLSDDKANEYFSDGVAEELLTVLQKIPGLHVAARTSAFSFKGKSATAQEIGEKLGVATLVEGSVRKAGGSVRITARLSRAATGEQLWSESYTRDLKDVFAVQSELAETIVGQLRGQLGLAATKAEIQAQVQAAEKGGTKNVEAHELYLQGKYFLNRATLEDTARATALLQRAVALDPSFALAWAALSGAGWFRGGYGLNRQDFDEGFALARRAADQAVAIEPALAAGHIARLDLQASTDFDWQGAKESLRRAQALAPDDVAVIFRGAQLAYSFGQMDRAVDLIRKTTALDPVNPLVYTNAGYIFLSLRRFDDAVAAFSRVRELSPDSPWGHAGIAMALVAAGRSDEARAEAALGTSEWSRLYALSLAEWGRKNHGEADKVLAQFIAGNAEVAAYQVACVYAWRGETDHAFEWLERAYRQRDPGLGWGRADFFLQGLHADPRWPAFMKKLGVTDQQLP